MNRRQFMQASSGAALTALASGGQGVSAQAPRRPAVVSSANGLRAVDQAMEMLRNGANTLDAVIAGVNLVEEDPTEQTVGYGGLPNEHGVVQLDASVMHGPTRGAGAVAALEGIMHPSKVARMVMEYTDHVLLVGEGALKFALAMGFETQDLLTQEARERWLKWKRELNPDDNWIEPNQRLPETIQGSERSQLEEMLYSYGTINCNAVDVHGNLSGVTTTSGLAFKIPGRVGDSPIIGAGLYVDNDVGACGSTGRGEANIKTCASFMVVEYLRQGVGAEEAALRVLKRISENTVEPYLRDDQGRPRFNLIFYVLTKQGESAGASLWSGSRYAVHDGESSRLLPCAYLFQRDDPA